MRAIPLLAYAVITGIALAAPEPKPTLLDLAKKKFAARPLTVAEEKLFTETEKGQEASILTNDEKEDDPANAEHWSDDRLIHAECLAWLCTDPEATKHITYYGIRIAGAPIDGQLDLEFAQVAFPLQASKCAFTDEIILRHAHLPAVYFYTTKVRDVAADGVKIDGNIFLRNGFKSEGQISLIGATIGGDLDCDHDTQFSNSGGYALIADGAKITGYAFFRDGFKAEGEVNFLGATIGRNLECDHAQFSNPNRKSINADAITVKGSVFLRNGFKSSGEVNFLVGKIDGTLDCTGAEFDNPSGYGLQAEGIKIGSSVFLTDGFKVDGGLNLFAAEIKGHLFWYKVVQTPASWVSLDSAKIATLHDEEQSWPATGHLFLDGFTYDRISWNSPVSPESRLQWLRRQSGNMFLPQPYEQLASVLRSMGYERAARKVMIQKNRDHANFTKAFSHEWWWYNVFGWLIGYGYAPSIAFGISLGWIVIGYFLFKAGYSVPEPDQLILATDDRVYVKKDGQIVTVDGKPAFSEHYPKFNAFVYSLESFTPLLKLDQSANWAPSAKRGKCVRILRFNVTTGSLLRAYLWIHIIAGWIFTSLWVGAVTGLVKS